MLCCACLENPVIFSASLLISVKRRHPKADPSALLFGLSMKYCNSLSYKKVTYTFCSRKKSSEMKISVFITACAKACKFCVISHKVVETQVRQKQQIVWHCEGKFS